jgi:DNA polymerase-1
MVRINSELRTQKLRTMMILQVHDELVFEVPEAELAEVKKIVTEEMEHALPLSVPVKVDVGYGVNWAAAK